MMLLRARMPILIAVLTVARLANAQDSKPVGISQIPKAPPIRVTYDMATRRVIPAGEGQGFRGTSGSAAGLQKNITLCFDNSLATGVYADLTNHNPMLDFADKSCGATGVMGSFEFSYRTIHRWVTGLEMAHA